MAQDIDSPAPSRRERKRTETRNTLINAALELFSERGFDDVTVTDIAERADVDPSTFFRHFGSKDAVLFVDVAHYVDRMTPALAARPMDEPMLDSLAAATVAVAGSSASDRNIGVLRSSLESSSPAIRAQGLVYREQLTTAISEVIAERLGVDRRSDLRPQLLATAWISAFEWYRTRPGSQLPRQADNRRALTDITKHLRRALSWAADA